MAAGCCVLEADLLLLLLLTQIAVPAWAQVCLRYFAPVLQPGLLMQ